jgi:hypothetical protein
MPKPRLTVGFNPFPEAYYGDRQTINEFNPSHRSDGGCDACVEFFAADIKRGFSKV